MSQALIDPPHEGLYSITMGCPIADRAVQFAFRTESSLERINCRLAEDWDVRVTWPDLRVTSADPAVSPQEFRGRRDLCWRLNWQRPYEYSFQTELSWIDELFVFLDVKSVYSLSSESMPAWMQDLILEAQRFSVPCAVHALEDTLGDEACRKMIGDQANSRAVHRQVRRSAQMARLHQVGEICVYADYGASGLWLEGKSLPIESLDLPPELIRRIALWQWHFDHYLDPYAPNQAEAYTRYTAEQAQIIAELQGILPASVMVRG